METNSSRWVCLIENRKATNKILRERRALYSTPVKEIDDATEDDLGEAREHIAAARKVASSG